MTSIKDRIEALPEADRLAIKTRAKAAKDAILDRAPELTVQPLENALHEICVSATFDDWETGNSHDGETLSFIQEMLDGHGDRADVMAMRAVEESEIVRFRKQEAGYRKMAGIASELQEEGFSLSADAAPAI